MTDNDSNNITSLVSHRDYAMKIVSRLLPPSDVEDVVQEAYIKAFQMMKRKTIDYPKTYLCTIAKNLAFDLLKRAHLTVSIFDDENELSELQLIGRQDDTHKKVCVEQSLERVSEAMRLIPEKCRRVLILKKVYGYKNKEIATELDVTIKTVEAHMTTGIKRFNFYMKTLESRTTLQEAYGTEKQRQR
ncbi:RNA polymerase sigma factor [Colwellia piezophila]|uniref:RNA polymerase sigma factor n=1 Tax=Colwellia piezophila TaxID=211668 RepID=UPI00035F6E7E|nr:RNA polymerase sigma factor [Colwellia piezophila]